MAAALNFPPTLAWQDNTLRLLDQTLLPAQEAYVAVKDVAHLCDCIKRLVVRGAPAIGCAAAYGTVLAAREAAAAGAGWPKRFDALCDQLAASRPTAVNLMWAVERCRTHAHAASEKDKGSDAASVERELLDLAKRVQDEDRAMCEAIGRHGATLLPKKKALLMTHCNAGALATGGSGTALSVMYAAQAAGIALEVYADETRPLLQGARLTAWELTRAGIPVTVICDNMAASVMRAKHPDGVVVGADRIAANGDVANKIGTYGLAVLARHHGVPFYVAAPSSTFDLTLADGSQIPIEERARAEIAQPYGVQAVPDGAATFNPAFDVTPAELVTALITEKGVLRPPYKDSIAKVIGA